MKNFILKAFRKLKSLLGFENTPKTPAEPPVSNGERYIRAVLDTVDVRHPENCIAFRSSTPLLHQYPFAIDFINKYGYVTTEYVKNVIQKISDKHILHKIEEVAINNSCQNLMYYMQDGGFKWSEQGKALIKQKRPQAYERFFERA